MITVRKQEVANWLLLDYQAKLFTLQEKLRFFEQKYQQSWNTFETTNKNRFQRKIFSQWDDYMEWKAYIKMVEEIVTKINEVQHGNFEVA